MDQENTFKTKTGYCHVLPDRIILTRDGVIENVSKIPTENSLTKILIIYGVLSTIFVYNAYNRFIEGLTLQAAMFAALAVLLAFGILSSLHNSAVPIIDRKRIREVRLKKAIGGLTRSRFEVLFEDEDGKTKRRLIMLPGSLSGGSEATNRAIEIMERENLLKSNT